MMGRTTVRTTTKAKKTEDQPNAQTAQHHGKQQEDSNNDKDLHHQMNKQLEEEQGMGQQYEDEAQAQVSFL